LQVRKIAEFLGVPKNVIEKKSSAHLWKEHEAEKEIGVSYEEIDSILYCLFDKKLSVEDTASKAQIEKSTVQKVYNLYLQSEHKRSPAQKPLRD
jgi:NAD+ synthase